MNSIQKNQTSMMWATLTVLDKFHDTWASSAGMARQVEILRGKLNLLAEESKVQETPVKGLTAKKNSSKAQMAGLAFEAASAMISWADINQDPGLKGRVNFSHTELMQVTDLECHTLCSIIYGEASGMKEQLVPDYLREESLSRLNALLESFSKAAMEPRTARSFSKTSTNNIAGLLRECSALLKLRIDKLAIAWRDTAPDFYKDYRDARTLKGMPRQKAVAKTAGNPVKEQAA